MAVVPCSPLRTLPPIAWSGRRKASLHSAPLRTVHATFMAHGSSEPRCVPGRISPEREAADGSKGALAAD